MSQGAGRNKVQNSGNEGGQQRSGQNQLSPPPGGYNRFVDDDFLSGHTNKDDTGPKPLSERPMTDRVCLVIFILAGLVFLCISAYGVYEGDPSKLGAPMDPDGNICGHGLAKEYPFIYWIQPWEKKNLYMTVCVKKCLENAEKGDHVNNPLQCLPNSVVPSCKFGVDRENPSYPLVVYYSSVPLMGKVCIPKTLDYFKESASAMHPPKIDSWASDVNQTSGVIVSSLLITLVLGLLFIFLTSKTTKCVVWSFIICYIVGLLVFSVYCFIKSQPNEEFEEDKPFQDAEDLISAAKEQTDSSGMYLAFAITALLVDLISIVLLIVYREKITRTMQIIDTAADFIIDNLIILVVPLITFLCILIYLMYWVTVMVFYFSAGTRKDLPVTERFPFGQFEYNNFLRFMIVVHFLTLFYYLSFLITFGHYLICSAFTYWYFKTGQDTDDPEAEAKKQAQLKKQGFEYNPFNSIRVAFAGAIKYHFGSIALGSLVQLFLGIPAGLAVIIREIRQKSTGDQKTDNGCCRSSLYWVTSNSYVAVAYNGEGYRTSGLYASALVDKNYDTYSVAASLGTIFIFLGNIFITFIVVLISYGIIQYTGDYTQRLNSPFLPIAIIAVVSFITSSCFMGVFASSVEANLICYFIELKIDEMNQRDITKSGKKLNQSMRNFLDSSAKKPSGGQGQY